VWLRAHNAARCFTAHLPQGCTSSSAAGINTQATIKVLVMLLDVCDSGTGVTVDEVAQSLYYSSYSLNNHWNASSGGRVGLYWPGNASQVVWQVRLPCSQFNRSRWAGGEVMVLGGGSNDINVAGAIRRQGLLLKRAAGAYLTLVQQLLLIVFCAFLYTQHLISMIRCE
jgi:hypothetical protein